MERWPNVEAQSALVVLVPEAEEFAGPYREMHDPAAAAGIPAHVTTLFPFRPPAQIDDAVIGRLRTCCRACTPFGFELVAVGRFPGVLYLAPDPADRLRALTLLLWREFPDCPPYEGRHPDIVPHLTLASNPDEETINGIERQVRSAAGRVLPLRARADAVVLMDNLAGRWNVVEEFRLGGS